MKSSTHLIRLAKALALTAVLAGAAVPAALAANDTRDRRPPDIRNAAAATSSETLPDAVDRYLVAHSSETLPDAVDRYLVAHPNGQTRAQAETTASHFKSGLRRSATAIQAGASNGFDWSDYGVGIGTGIGLVLLFAGGLAAARQRRHPVQAA